jgi:hypothetical protein
MSNRPDPIDDDDPDVVEQPPDALALRHPAVPTTLAELAALRGEAIEVIHARVQILATVRSASLAAVSPPDLVLFKARDEDGGQVVAYLEDVGAQRVRSLWGVSIFDVSNPEKVAGTAPDDFYYIVRGSGRCALTGQVVENVEGGRGSKEDFCKDKRGAELDKAVRRAARANLNGSIVRELCGLGSIPIEEIAAAWQGTDKSIENCRRGRGFGTREQRQGGGEKPDEGLIPPACPVCRKIMILRSSARGFFYSCADWKAHGRDAKTIDLDAWKKDPRSKPKLEPAPAPVTNGTPAPAPPRTVDRMLDADEIFNRGREPGEEG